jgi:hypothetical protein
MDGNSYADSFIDHLKNKDEQTIDIGKPARFSKSDDRKGIYYQARRGVLDVVYVGSLINLGLIIRLTDKENLLVPSPEGKSLAASYQSNINEPNKLLFFKAVKDGSIRYPQLIPLLQDFDLFKDIRNSAEWRDYKSLLIGPDYGTRTAQETYFRRENILHFLNHCSQFSYETANIEFPAYYFENKGFLDNNPTESSKLWYATALSEKIHYCQEVVFWCILKKLDEGNNRIPIKQFAENFAQSAIISVDELNGTHSNELSLARWAGSLSENEEREVGLKKDFRKSKWQTNLGLALTEWYSIYHLHEKFLPAISKALTEDKLIEHRGNFCIDFSAYFQSLKELNLENCFRRLCLRMINQHIEVAFEKMNQGRNNVLRFTIEDNCLIKLDDDSPAMVANRISQFQGFLTDMRFINSAGLTPDGDLLLKELLTDEEIAA